MWEHFAGSQRTHDKHVLVLHGSQIDWIVDLGRANKFECDGFVAYYLVGGWECERHTNSFAFLLLFILGKLRKNIFVFLSNTNPLEMVSLIFIFCCFCNP